MKTFRQFILESPEKQKISIFPGRFQPFHNGHKKIIEMMRYKPVVLLVKGEGTSGNKEKNPFDEKYQEYMIRKVFPGIEITVIRNVNLSPIRYHLEKSGEREVGEILAGPDRIPSYRSQLKDFVDRIRFTETPRVTSATAVRETIRTNNEAEFKRLMPHQLWNEWDKMVEIMKSA